MHNDKKRKFTAHVVLSASHFSHRYDLLERSFSGTHSRVFGVAFSFTLARLYALYGIPILDLDCLQKSLTVGETSDWTFGSICADAPSACANVTAAGMEGCPARVTIHMCSSICVLICVFSLLLSSRDKGRSTR